MRSKIAIALGYLFMGSCVNQSDKINAHFNAKKTARQILNHENFVVSCSSGLNQGQVLCDIQAHDGLSFTLRCWANEGEGCESL